MLTKEEIKIVHELLDGVHSPEYIEQLLESNNFKFGMRVARDHIEKHFGKLTTRQKGVE